MTAPTPLHLCEHYTHILIGPLFLGLRVEADAPLCAPWQAWLLKCHPDHRGDTERRGRGLGKWDEDGGRAGKHTERGRQGSRGIQGKMDEDGGEARGVSRWDYGVSMKGRVGFLAEKSKGEDGVGVDVMIPEGWRKGWKLSNPYAQ